MVMVHTIRFHPCVIRGADPVLILRIRQAESALNDGRLDEAFELAGASEFRSHARGQKLIGLLVKALVERGESHRAAGRLAQASADCDKARQLSGNDDAVESLRSAIRSTAEALQAAGWQQAEALAAAKRHIDEGRLSLGERALSQLDSNADRVGKLRHEIGAARALAADAIQRVRSAVERSDWAQAVDALTEARRAHATNTELNGLFGRTADMLVDEANRAIDAGRLDLAERIIRKADDLGSQTLQWQDLMRFIEQCRSAAREVSMGRARRAVELLRRLRSTRPDVAWLNADCEQAERAAESLERLRGGPLGLLGATELLGHREPASSEQNTGERRTVRLPAPAAHTPGPWKVEATPARPAADNDWDRFMIQVNGVGSFLVLRRAQVTVGPVSSPLRPDLGLLADASLPVATIERVEEDYFLASQAPIEVGGGQATRRLLQDGDRIALGPRCHLKFTKPNAASTTAVLHLTGSRLPKGDARRVILMDQAVVIGPGRSAHVRADRLSEPVVLHVRSGRLLARSNEDVEVDGRPMDRQQGISMNTNVKIGPLSFAVTSMDAVA